MTEDHHLPPARVVAELGRIRLVETDLTAVLTQVTRLTRRTVPAAAAASITLIDADGPYTPASTGDLAFALDTWQYEEDQGPCLAAATGTVTVTSADLAAEDRWPRWAGRAAAAGARSCLSIGLPLYESVAGALNVYAAEPDAFDAEAAGAAQALGGYAAVTVANAHAYGAAAALADHMQTAMASRAVIEQAKGIIMGRQRCSADAAFAILTRTSQDTNRKVRDIAAALVARTAEP